MKSTGIVRPIDQLGRIVLPKELRDILDISPKDCLEVFVENEKIILKKYAPSCIFCEDSDDVTYYKSKLVCRRCLDALKDIAN
jgi:transcriptional pleiotropic regulator of transition state genes